MKNDKKNNSRRKSKNNKKYEKFSNDAKTEGANGYKDDRKRDLSDNFCRGNDPAWYNRNKQLIDDAARFPWAYPTGINYHLDDAQQFNVNPPAIMVLETLPVPGLSKNASSAINKAASGLYQYTRKNLSTVASYAAADQFMVNLAIDSIYTLWAHITRLFGMVHLFSARNLNVNKNMICAIYKWSDEQFNDFVENLAGYRARFNVLVYTAATFYMPTNYDITRRHTWLFSNYFTDVQSVRAQYYAYTPAYVYKLNETELETGTALEPLVIDTGRDFSWYLDLFESLIEALRSSDLAQMVMADERKAYEDQSFYTLRYVERDFVLPPAYSKEALLQIHNTDIVGRRGLERAGDQYNLWVRQDVNGNYIKFDPTFIADQVTSAPHEGREWPDSVDMFKYLSGARMLDCAEPSPSTDEILEMTRNTTTLTRYQSTSAYAKFDSINCDVVIEIVMYGKGWHDRSDEAQHLISNLIGASQSKIVTAISNFDWAPILWIPDQDQTYTGRHFQVLGDINEFTIVDHNAIAQLNNNVQMSMWSVPELGAYDGK